MTGTDRGLSLASGAALAIVGLVIVVAVVFLGASALGGSGPADAGNETTPTATPTPMTETPTPTTTAPPTTTVSEREQKRQQFKTTFADALHEQHSDLEVIDMVIRNNTVYVTTHGPAQGGPAVATADNMGKAFTEALQIDWSDESTDLGIDHAVLQLYNETDYHWFTVRIEESWAYEYHIGNTDIQRLTNQIDRNSHKVGVTQQFLDMDKFRQNVSSLDGVEVRSLEQYGGMYFLALEMDDFSGDDYNQTIFRISEAFYHDRNFMDKITYLNYVICAPNGTAVTTNIWSSSIAKFWHEGEISKSEYKNGIVWKEFDAKQVPNGIGQLLTRIQPFPAKGPGE